MRAAVKRALAFAAGHGPARGATLLIYHRVGGGSADERDLATRMFRRQLDLLVHSGVDVVPLDVAVDRLESGDDRPSVVLTFDDGFADVFEHGWPALVERNLPFTVYLATRYVGETMHWDGSTATAAGAALTWDQLREMVGSGLCTVGNHTHSHARPDRLDPAELDTCTEQIQAHLGVRPAHFTYPWGVRVPEMEDEVRRRFRTASTGELGRNEPGVDLARLHRVPVRRTDPIEFFGAKLTGRLVPERVYARVVATAKAVGISA